MTVLPESITRLPDWEEKYGMLEEHLRVHTVSGEEEGVDASSACFWLVTSNPKLNEWLVYNKIELKKARRQTDKTWQARRHRLAELGFHYGL